MSLLEKLAGDLGTLHFEQIEGLNTQAARIAAAEQLAQRLQSCVINTIATGRIGPDGAAMIWLSANTSMPRIQEALAKINQEGVNGMLIKTPSGILRRSPLMDVIRDLALEMKGYETEMGFTPAARSRISVQKDSGKEQDPWSEIAG